MTYNNFTAEFPVDFTFLLYYTFNIKQRNCLMFKPNSPIKKIISTTLV